MNGQKTMKGLIKNEILAQSTEYADLFVHVLIKQDFLLYCVQIIETSQQQLRIGSTFASLRLWFPDKNSPKNRE
jgi:hypothetical protein